MYLNLIYITFKIRKIFYNDLTRITKIYYIIVRENDMTSY